MSSVCQRWTCSPRRSALGAFILISMVLMPYFLRVEPEEVNRLRRALQEAQAQLRNCQQELHTCKRRLSNPSLKGYFEDRSLSVSYGA